MSIYRYLWVNSVYLGPISISAITGKWNRALMPEMGDTSQSEVLRFYAVSSSPTALDSAHQFWI